MARWQRRREASEREPPPELVVDLGVLDPSEAAADDRPPAPGWRGRWAAVRAGWSDPVAARRRRRWSPLVAVLLVGLLAGSARPLPADPVRIALPTEAAGDDQRLTFAGDLVLVSEGHGGWTAYDATTGARRWSVETPVELFAVADVVVQSPPRGAPVDAVVGIDAVTGEVRWRRPNLRVVPGAAVGLELSTRRGVTGDSPDGPGQVPGSSGHPPATDLHGVDLVTGGELWRVRTDGVYAWLLGDPATVVTASPDGALGLREPATGEPLARRPGAGEDLDPYPLLVRDGVLVMRFRGDDRQVLRGYRTDTLTLVWERRIPAREASTVLCGGSLCLVSAEFHSDGTGGDGSRRNGPGVRVTVLDPATGRTTHPAGSMSMTVHYAFPRDDPSDLWPHLSQLGVDRLSSTVVLEGGPDGRPVLVVLEREPEEQVPPHVPGDPDFCTWDDHRLACRYGDELRVWDR